MQLCSAIHSTTPSEQHPNESMFFPQGLEDIC